MYCFSFCKSLRIAQEVNGIKSVDLARSCGVRKQQVARWRKMEDAPLSLVCKISAKVGLTPMEFLRLGVDNADF